MSPKVLVLTGYGINCEEETRFAFATAGATAEVVHINDLIDGTRKLTDYKILAMPGGFSYGDDTGSGNAMANRIRNHLWEALRQFIEDDQHLVIGICNGFQMLANLGLLPALDGAYGTRQVALLDNTQARFLNRWVDVEFSGASPWVKGLKRMSMPIAHGEGRLYAPTEVIQRLHEQHLVAARYVAGEICEYQQLESNPNGSIDAIAGLTDETGRILGLMPHPERAMHFTHRPDWTLKREQLKRAGKEIPEEGEGLAIFRNGVQYCS